MLSSAHVPTPSARFSPPFPEISLGHAYTLVAQDACPREQFFAAVVRYVEHRRLSATPFAATLRTLTDTFHRVQRHLVAQGATPQELRRATRLADEAITVTATQFFGSPADVRAPVAYTPEGGPLD